MVLFIYYVLDFIFSFTNLKTNNYKVMQDRYYSNYLAMMAVIELFSKPAKQI